MIDITRARAIPGWMSQRELRWLAEHAQDARVILEIGCSRGRSTRALGEHTAGVVHSIDAWCDYPTRPPGYGAQAQAQAHQNLADLIAAGRVRLWPGTSADIVPMLAESLSGTVDLVFLDGDHSYEAVRDEIALCRPLLRAGGLLAGHDYNGVPRHAGVRRAVDELVPGAHVAGSIWWSVQ